MSLRDAPRDPAPVPVDAELCPRRSGRLLATSAVILLLTCGCWFRGPGDVKRELSSAAGVHLDRQFGMTVGGSSLWLTKRILHWTHSDEEIPVSLQGVRKVQVGVYEVAGLRSDRDDPGRVQASHFPSWLPVAQVHDEGEDVLVLVKQDRQERIRGMLVVVAESDEWVVVRLRGKLDRVIEDAMQLAFEQADRPDLYARTLEERRPTGNDQGPEESGHRPAGAS